MKSFESLSEREVLALAISLEEEDARIYDDFAEGLRENYPAQAEQFHRFAGRFGCQRGGGNQHGFRRGAVG